MNNQQSIIDRNEIASLRYKLLVLLQTKKETGSRHRFIKKLESRLTELLIRMQNNRQLITLKWLPVLQASRIVEGAK